MGAGGVKGNEMGGGLQTKSRTLRSCPQENQAPTGALNVGALGTSHRRMFSGAMGRTACGSRDKDKRQTGDREWS